MSTRTLLDDIEAMKAELAILRTAKLDLSERKCQDANYIIGELRHCLNCLNDGHAETAKAHLRGVLWRLEPSTHNEASDPRTAKGN